LLPEILQILFWAALGYGCGLLVGFALDKFAGRFPGQYFLGDSLAGTVGGSFVVLITNSALTAGVRARATVIGVGSMPWFANFLSRNRIAADILDALLATLAFRVFAGLVALKRRNGP